MVLLAAAYRLYGRWLGRHVFELDSARQTPAVSLRDDQDFVPTSKAVLFGHHFTSIAGTGPIVGPALAVMWGWLPALIWVWIGSIFIGAVHDLGSLVVSIRSCGQTVGDVAGRVLNPRVRLLFLWVLFMALTIVLAIFGLVIAAVFRAYPSSIFPCLIQIPLAVVIGIVLHRRGSSLTVPSVVALVLMYVSVLWGNVGWLGEFNAALASMPTIAWVAVLLGYSYIASVLPVWLLLQPRDYINSLQLITALGLVVIGLVAAAFFGAPSLAGGDRVPLELAAPAVRIDLADAPAMIPFLFVTIACGACSGFHCLVSSGTSSKQIASECDAVPIGYGSMLTEGFLATIVILACVAGIGLGTSTAEGQWLVGPEAFQARYASWASASGLAVKIGAFVDGSANFLRAIGVPLEAAVAVMGVLVASFAGTTLDTACRLQRYVVQEIAAALAGRSGLVEGGSGASAGVSAHPQAHRWRTRLLGPLRNKHGATIFAIVLAMLIAALPAPGTPVSIADAWNGVPSNPGVDEPAEVVSGFAGLGVWLSTYGGKGGMILWPLFGATNQLLAGLAFLVIAFYLRRRGVPLWFITIPMVFMLIVPAWAMFTLVPQWMGADSPNWVVIVIGVATLILEGWMIVEAALLWPKVANVLEPPAVAGASG